MFVFKLQLVLVLVPGWDEAVAAERLGRSDSSQKSLLADIWLLLCEVVGTNRSVSVVAASSLSSRDDQFALTFLTDLGKIDLTWAVLEVKSRNLWQWVTGALV